LNNEIAALHEKVIYGLRRDLSVATMALRSIIENCSTPSGHGLPSPGRHVVEAYNALDAIDRAKVTP
jgi:hypothetical protein